MACSIGLVRPVALGAIAICSTLGGLLLTFRLVTPALVAQLPTAELLGLLALLVLPGFALWAAWADRAASAEVVLEEPGQEKIGDIEVVIEEELVEGVEIEVHAPGRRAVRHRRLEGTRISG